MGSIVRTPFQPLAHLVDAAAEKWLVAERGSPADRAAARADITDSFSIGEQPELTFHGIRFLLTIAQGGDGGYRVSVHEIAVPE